MWGLYVLYQLRCESVVVVGVSVWVMNDVCTEV